MEKQEIIFIISLLFIGISIFFFILILLINKYNAKANNCRKTKGKIITSTLIKEKNSYPIDTDMAGPTDQTKYVPKIEFEGILNGDKFMSNKLYYSSINNMFFTSSFSKNIVKKFPEGKEVEVYIRPDKKNYIFLIKKYLC
ncbi:hypothetical protein [Tenacibaculum sp. SG-28]|uniref:hypothetical protein n=1 Tax=Tenacibaculum sp. SG-28 TaxID=754426 RepID=UPI000CF46C29|nr:hypothetical protein [Tenacibaculum sp. SG-28]PQJ23481.1 hypothetical protein BSU00_04700 [Tenacibaculum sp. SG-28]